MLGSPYLIFLVSYAPGPGKLEFFIFWSLQFGTLLKKIELFPDELKSFGYYTFSESYLPGPGRSAGGCVFSLSFLGSKSLRFVLLAAKLGSRDTPLTAS